MTTPPPPRQSSAFVAFTDSIIMKLLGIGICLLGGYLLFKEVVPMTTGVDPRQSTVGICIFAAMLVLGAGMAVGSRFVTFLTGLGGAVGGIYGAVRNKKGDT